MFDNDQFVKLANILKTTGVAVLLFLTVKSPEIEPGDPKIRFEHDRTDVLHE